MSTSAPVHGAAGSGSTICTSPEASGLHAPLSVLTPSSRLNEGNHGNDSLWRRRQPWPLYHGLADIFLGVKHRQVYAGDRSSGHAGPVVGSPWEQQQALMLLLALGNSDKTGRILVDAHPARLASWKFVRAGISAFQAQHAGPDFREAAASLPPFLI